MFSQVSVSHCIHGLGGWVSLVLCPFSGISLARSLLGSGNMGPRDYPPGQWYSLQAVGTHPTGMISCYKNTFKMQLMTLTVSAGKLLPFV